MMDIDKQLQTHLDALMQMEMPEEFGPALVQRHCRIGYNNACHVLERGVSSGLLIRASVPYRYRAAKTIVVVGTMEQQLLLEFLMEAAGLQLTPEQQDAALEIIAHQPVGMTMADFLVEAKADTKHAQLLACFVAALEPIANSDQYRQLLDSAHHI